MEGLCKERLVEFTVDLWNIELLRGIEAKGLLHRCNISISELQRWHVDAKQNDCANMDKVRFAFDRLRPFEGSNNRSRLINYRDQPEETKERLEK